MADESEVIQEIINEPAIQKQVDFMTDKLLGLKKILNDLNSIEINLKAGGSISQIRTGMEQTAAATKSAGAELKGMQDASAGIDTILKKVNQSVLENNKQQIRNKLALEDVKDEQKRLRKEYDEGRISIEKYEESAAALLQSQREHEEQNKRLVVVTRNVAKEQDAAANSINELRAKLNQMKADTNNLDIGSDEFQKAQTEIAKLNEQIKKLEFARGDFQRDVGNYSGSFGGAFKILKEELQRSQQELSKLDKESDTFKKQQKDVKTLEELVEGLGATFGSTRQEMKTLQETAAKVGLSFGQQSEIFQQVRKEVGEAKDSIDDIRDSVKLAASDTQQLDRLIGAAQGIAGAFSIAEGAAALFGGENEDLQRTFVRLQAALTILNGLQAIQAELTRKDSIFTGVATVAKKLYSFVVTGTTKGIQANTASLVANTAATEATTVAAKVATGAAITLRAALIATGIGALLVLIPTIVSGLGLFSDENDEAAKSQERLNDELERAKGALSDLNNQYSLYMKTREQETKEAVNAAKKRGATEEQIFNIEQNGLKKRRSELSQNLAIIKKNLEDERLVGDARTEYVEGQTKLEGEIRDIDIELQEKYLARRKQVSDKVKDLNAKDLKAEFEMFKRDKQLKAAEAGELANNSFTGIDTRIKKRVEQAEIEKQIIEGQQKFELQNTSLTEKEIDNIKDASAKNILAIEKSMRLDLIKINIDYREKIKEVEEKDLSDFKKRLDEEKAAQDKADLDAYQKRINNLQEGRDILLKASYLEEAVILKKARSIEERQKLEEGYQNKRLKLELETNKYILLASIEYQERLLAATKDKNVISELSAQIRELKKQLAELGVQEIDINANGAVEKLSELSKKLEGIQVLYNQIADVIGGAISASIDKQKNAIQDNIDGIEKKKAAEISAIQASTASEQEKADKIAVLEATAAAKKEQLELKQHQLDQKKAVFEKARIIWEIALNTALAIMKAAPPSPASFVAAAIGAAQLAVAIATPIPRFKGGTKNSPEGFAIVGDGGRREVVQNPDGSTYVTPDKSTLTYLQGGSKVFKSVEDYDRMIAQAGGGVLPTGATVGMDQKLLASEIKKSFAREAGRIVYAIYNKPETHSTLTSEGLKYVVKRGNQTTEYLTRNIYGR